MFSRLINFAGGLRLTLAQAVVNEGKCQYDQALQ